MLLPQAGCWEQSPETWGLTTGHRQAQQPWARLGQYPAPEEADWPCSGLQGPQEGLGAVRAVSPTWCTQELTDRTGACSQ